MQRLGQPGEPLTATELARRAGVSSTTLTRPLHDPNYPHAISGRTLAKVAEALEEPLPIGLRDRADAGVSSDTPDSVEIPEYEADFSAGGGRLSHGDGIRRWWPLPRWIVVDTLHLSPDRAAIHEVVGDSMEPTLSSGDFVILDLSDIRVGNPGVFACWDGDGLVIKRIERVIGADPPVLRIISDNPRHSTYEVPADDVRVFGRVRWRAQRT